MFGDTTADRALKQERAMKIRAEIAHDAAVERQVIKEFCADSRWEVIVVSLYRRRQAAEAIMLSSNDFAEVNKARAQYQELTWLMELPINI